MISFVKDRIVANSGDTALCSHTSKALNRRRCVVITRDTHCPLMTNLALYTNRRLIKTHSKLSQFSKALTIGSSSGVSGMRGQEVGIKSRLGFSHCRWYSIRSILAELIIEGYN